MAQPTTNRRIIQFALFELDLDARELRKSGVKIKLQEQPFQILAMLLERPGEIVTREELQKRLWPQDTFVDFDLSLNGAVKKLRQALGDDSANPRFIETLYRRGYRFIGQSNGVATIPELVSVSSNTSSENVEREFPSAKSSIKGDESRRSQLRYVVGITLMVVWGVTVAVMWLRTPSPPRVLSVTQLTNDNVPKGAIVTDGPRLYFEETIAERTELRQVSATGGEIVPVRTPFVNNALYDVSPSRSELLVDSFNGEAGLFTIDNAGPLWVVPVPAGSVRRLANYNVYSAAWSPDGRRIVYGDLHDLFSASWDGTQRHKIVSLTGRIVHSRFSPDGRHLRFTMLDEANFSFSIWEIATDGGGLRALLPANWHREPGECCGQWSPDGRYYFFTTLRNGRWDVWAIREETGLFSKSRREPVQLTAGPLSYPHLTPSLDGKRLFAVGEQERAELQRYDLKSRRFVPFLSGISAGHIDFSRDRQWVVYVAFPEATLWRSRIDGSEKMQLTSPPILAAMPRLSPDGKQVAFVDAAPGKPQKAYVISTEGGTPEELLPNSKSKEREDDPIWSPDGKTLILAQYPEQFSGTDAAAAYSIARVDAQTKQTSKISGASGMFAPRWSPDGRYVSTFSVDQHRLMLLDLSTGRWSELTTGKILQYPNWSPDSKYVYYEDFGTDGPEIDRVNIADRKKERLLGLKDVPRVSLTEGPWNGVAPDGSPLIMRDVGIRELYSLELQLP